MVFHNLYVGVVMIFVCDLIMYTLVHIFVAL
jgi:hypothetical protein